MLSMLLSLACGAAIVQPVSRTAPVPRACAIRCLAPTDEPIEILLFDPRSDELPFPFPAPRPSNALEEESTRPPSAYRYAFERSIHLRMLRDGLGDDGKPSACSLATLSPGLPHSRPEGGGETTALPSCALSSRPVTTTPASPSRHF